MDKTDLQHRALNETLNKLLLTSNSLNFIEFILDSKQKFLGDFNSKIEFPLEKLYICPNSDVDLRCSILWKMLPLIPDSETQLSQAIDYFIKKLLNEKDFNEGNVLSIFKFLNIIFKYHKWRHHTIVIDHNYTLFYAILFAVNKSPKSVSNFILVQVLPTCIDILSVSDREVMISYSFEQVKATENLELLCVLIDKLNLIAFDNIIYRKDFFPVLLNFITSRSGFVKKQAIFVLSKVIYTLIERLSSCKGLEKVVINLKKSWKNYFIIMDSSNEKQLHLVGPSLNLLDSAVSVGLSFRVALYKVLLSHSQNSIVYFVANFILQKEEVVWNNYNQFIHHLFIALNKNECSVQSKHVFQELGKVFLKLSQIQFEMFLQVSLRISWIPASLWCFYVNVFSETSKFQIPSDLLQKIIDNLNEIPNVYIRESCRKIVFAYLIRNFKYQFLPEFLNIAFVLSKDDEALKTFVSSVHVHENELRKYLFNSLDRRDNLKFIKLQLKIISLLGFQVPLIENVKDYSEEMDLINLYAVKGDDDLENYLNKRIDCMGKHEDMTYLLDRIRNSHLTFKIVDKAIQILLDTDITKYTDVERLVAFNVINQRCDTRCVKVIELWKEYFLNDKLVKNNHIRETVGEILLKHIKDNFESTPINLRVLEKILYCQNKTSILIYENINFFLRFLDNNLVFSFIELCLEEFLKLDKSYYTKATLSFFFGHILNEDFLENEKYSQKIFEYVQQFRNTSNNKLFACILSQLMSGLVNKKCEYLVNFVPLIVDFIIHGATASNKNERIEYQVNQDISIKLSTFENNPNLNEMSTRLYAIDSMLSLKNNETLSGDIADEFVVSLKEKYMKNFGKRYFPDSQIHLEKIRIIQVLLLIHQYVKKRKFDLIDMVANSFLSESHQSSVKHLLQWLLICLLKEESEFATSYISDKIKSVNNTRPSAVAGFIPVLYHLCICQEENVWDRFVQILLPSSMGPQFRLRVFSQIALMEIYEEAIKKGYTRFLKQHSFLYEGLKTVVEAAENAASNTVKINHDFLDYFCVEDLDFSTIYYTIPKINKVTSTEWENIPLFKEILFKNIHLDSLEINIYANVDHSVNNRDITLEYNENIQKKITPWREALDEESLNTNANDCILVTSLLEKSANLGGLSRTCEVFGVKKLVMRTAKIVMDKEFKSLSMSSENWVDVMEVKVEDLKDYILAMKDKGYCIVGAEQTSDSVKLNEFKFPKATLLLLGRFNEKVQQNIL